MNKTILDPEFQRYLASIHHENHQRISLSKSPFPSISAAEIAQQLKGRQIAQKKFPLLFHTPGIYYPPTINLEQASSEATANYKASLVKGENIIDLTAGFGMDSLAFSSTFEKVIHVEKNQSLSQIVASNAHTLEANLACFEGDFQTYFSRFPQQQFDCIYLDPARRNSIGRKFILKELEPNILDYLSDFWTRTNQLMVKLSPLLDLSATIIQVEHIKEIHLVAVKNEMKELLLYLDRNTNHNNPKIVCVNLQTNQEKFCYWYEEEPNTRVQLSEAQKYLYEPNAAIMKAGAFKLLSQRFPIYKLHQNTHLYTSEKIIENFPGKVFEIIRKIENPKKEITGQKANVLVRNYNQSIDNLKKKFKIKDGGDQTIIFCQTVEGFDVFLTKRVEQK
ncbi:MULTISPECIES: RsmD family RNA methyltransferase [Weeksella]|uniref:THUMP-like domain-containing protein n=1 Tax=Weeksella TaxID=1013 RepID=UPI0008A5207F|nr:MULTISPECIES: RsmD family RNA methyltransferase [Weeksella]MDK7375438.1 RsmD family RNA methyltransferase [Weeksella virosa]OFM84495.1 hypothetical protein HMPREF2660_08270 [Weeksella sp. HMSC059D05]